MRELKLPLLFTLLVTATALYGCGTEEEGPLDVGWDGSLAPVSPLRVIVRVGPGQDSEDIKALVAELGGQIVHDSRIIGAVTVVMPDREALGHLTADSSVSGVEEDVVVYALGSEGREPVFTWLPPRKYSTTQTVPWGIERVGAPAVHHRATGAGVKVAVLDTGIWPDHPDLRVAGGINFNAEPDTLPDYDDWTDRHGHGTHVAGTIAALDNCIHVVGMAPDAELYAVRVLNRHGYGYVSDIVAGLEWAIDNGMQVVNMSIGGWGGAPAYAEACQAAEAAGIYLAVAAGNAAWGRGERNDDGSPVDPDASTVLYPAAYPESIAVAATDDTDNIASFSSYGPQVEHAAPGVAVESTTIDGATGLKSGTSMAAPHDAGAAALLFGHNRKMTAACAREILSRTALDLGVPGRDVDFGNGLINVPAALKLSKRFRCHKFGKKPPRNPRH